MSSPKLVSATLAIQIDIRESEKRIREVGIGVLGINNIKWKDGHDSDQVNSEKDVQNRSMSFESRNCNDQVTHSDQRCERINCNGTNLYVHFRHYKMQEIQNVEINKTTDYALIQERRFKYKLVEIV